MKIICSLKPKQVEGLYGDIYRDMQKGMSKKELDVDVYLQDLFNEIEKVADTNTAVKFMQVAPLLMYTASTKIPNFATEVNFDPTKLLALNKRFSNKDNGLQEVLIQYRFMESPSVIRESIYKTELSVNVVSETDNQSNTVPFEFRSIFNLFSTSPNQFYVGDAKWREYVLEGNVLLPTEQDDQVYAFTTLKKILQSQSDTGIQVEYQNKKLKVVPTRLADLNANDIYKFDVRWFKSEAYSQAAGKKKSEFIKADELVVMVITDEKGSPVLFDEQGNISSEGKLIYQEMRNVIKKGKEYFLINRMGQDIFTKNTYKKFAEIQGISEVEARKMIQSELKSLYDIKQNALSGKRVLLDMIGVHPGEPRFFHKKDLSLNNLDSLNFVDENTFKSIDIVKTGDEQFEEGRAIITLKGDRYQLQRPSMTEDIANKIFDVLADTNLSYDLRKEFLMTYLPVKAAESQARHRILYLDNNKKIVFKYFDKTQLEGRGEEKTLILTNKNAREVLKDVLMRGRVLNNTMKPVSLNYSSKALKYNQYLDYVDGKLVSAEQSYIDFLKSFTDTKIYVTPNYDDKVNQAIYYAPEGSVLSQIINSQDTNNTDSLIRQAKDALVEHIKKKGALEVKITDITRGTDQFENRYGFFEIKSPVGIVENIRIGMTPELKTIPADKLSIRVGDSLVLLVKKAEVEVQDENGKITTAVYDDVIVAHWNGLNVVGTVRETDFNAREQRRKPKPVKSNEQDIKDNIESKHQGNSKEDDGGVAGKYFTRSKALKQDKGTKAQNKKAEEWFKNSDVSKYLDLKRAVNIVNSNAYADFLAYGAILGNRFGVITLYGDASSMDIYHEAWHGFTQLFLTQKQKKDLYAEVQKRLKGADKLSYRDIEEILAEEFRTYAKDPKAVKNSPKRNTIFRKILNFINWLFGTSFGSNSIVTNVFEIENVKELYENLYYNKDLNNYTPSLDNIQWDYLTRSTGITDSNNQQVLDRSDSKQVSQSLDSFLSKQIDLVTKELNYDRSFAMKMVLDPRNKRAFYEQAFKEFTKVKEGFEETLKEYEENPDQFKLEIENTKNIIRILTESLENWGNPTKGVVKFHLENSDFTILNSKQLDDIQEENELEEEAIAEEDINELEQFRRDKIGRKSLLEIADKEVIFMLKSLFAVDKNGNTIKDMFGFDKLADFNVTWNNTARAIAGLQDPMAMYEALKEASNLYAPFKQLLDFKLPNPSLANSNVKGNTAYFNNKSVTSFWQAFSKSRVPYFQYTIFGDNAVVIQASIQSDKILREFRNKYRSADSNYTIRDDKTNALKLNIDRVLTDFADSKGNLAKGKYLEFARAIGIYLDESPTIREELTADEEAKSKYGLPYMYNALKLVSAAITRNNNDEQTIKDLEEFLLEPIRGFYRGLPTTLVPGNKPFSQRSQLLELAKLQGRFGDVSNIFGVINAEGNLVYEFINNNSTTKQAYALNTVDKLSDLWTAGGYMSYLNPENNTFTRNSAILRSMFYGPNQNYGKRPGTNLRLFVNSGTKSYYEGVSTTSLDYYGKLLQEANTMVSFGMQEFMRTADKRSSFGAKVEGGIRSANRFEDLPSPIDPYLYVPLKLIAENSYRNHVFTNFALPYLASELDRIYKFKQNPEVFKTYSGYNRLLSDGKTYAGEVFTAFSDILSSSTQLALIQVASNFANNNRSFDALTYFTNPQAYGEIEELQQVESEYTSDLLSKIEEEVYNYFEELSTETLNEFLEQPFISQDVKDKMIELKVSSENFNSVFTKTYAINSFIHNFEVANLFLGDVVQFNHPKEDLHKRNAGATSVAPSFRTDVFYRDYVAGWMKDTSYAKQNGKQFLDFSRGTFNTAVLTDPLRTSRSLDLIEEALTKLYTKELEEVTILDKKLKKDKLKAEVKRRVEADLNKYKNIEEADGQGYITLDAYRLLKDAEGKWDVEQENLFQKISRGEEITAEELNQFLPVYKLFNFGFLEGTMAPVTAMHKFALVPLLPSVYGENTDLGNLHNQMMENNIQYVTFKSGSKLGSVSKLNEKGEIERSDNPFASEDQKTIAPKIDFTPNTVYLEYLKNVTEVPSKFKINTIISTQARAILLKGMYEKGVVKPEFKNIADNYINAVNELTEIKKIELLSEINWKVEDGKYVGKLSNFLDLVVRELGRKALPQHQIDYIQAARDGNIRQDLSFHLEADTIQKMMIAIIEKRIITQKAHGESLIQMSGALSNGLVTGLTEKQIEDNDVRVVGSNNFPFFTINKDGKTNGLKIGIAMQGDYLNLLNLEDPAGLTEDIYKASFAQLESMEGDDKLFILESKLTPELLAELQLDDKGGKRVKGEVYEGIEILGDFYSHTRLKSKNRDALDIIVVKDQETARKQVKAYKEGGAKQFTKLLYKREGEKRYGTLGITQPIGSIKRLNELLKDDEWLDANNKANRRKISVVGARIPGQTLGSIPLMEIYEFLDPTFANTVIVPTEFIVINGSDFDVDSVKSLFKNLTAGGNEFGKDEEGFTTIPKATQTIRTRTTKGDQYLLFPQNYRGTLTELLDDTSDRNIKAVLSFRSKVAENNLMNAMIDILALPQNLGNMVRPNSTAILKDKMANKLAPHVQDYNKLKNKTRKDADGQFLPTRVFEPIYNHQKSNDFLTGGIVLGIGAIENKLDPVMNMIGAKMPLTYKNPVWDEEKGVYIDGNLDYNVQLFLPYNEFDDTGAISLSDIYNLDGEDISQLFSQNIDGLVDRINDDFIKYLQANREVAPVTFFLTKAGVPLDYLYYFTANPFVRFYVKEQRKMRSAYAETTDIIPKMDGQVAPQMIPYKAAVNTILNLAPNYFKGIMKSKALSNKGYYDAIEKYVIDTNVLDDNGDFKLNDLKLNVEKVDGKHKRSPINNYTAMASFLHFLEIEKQIKGFTNLKLNSNRDTTRSKSLGELLLRDQNFLKLNDNTKIAEGLAARMKEQSLLSSFFIQDLIKDLVVPGFEFRSQPIIQNYILNNLGDYTRGMNRDEISSYLTRFQNGVTDLVYQNIINQFSVQEIPLPLTDRKLTMNYDNIIGVGKDNFSETFLEIVLALPDTVKQRFSVLGQLEVVPQKRKASLKEEQRRKRFLQNEIEELKSENKQEEVNQILYGKEDIKIISLTNIADAKRNQDLSDQYHKELVQLADPNIKKLANAEDNARLSSLFAMLPLITVLQTGTGSYNPLSLNFLVDNTLFANIMSTIGNGWAKQNLNETLLNRVAYLNKSGDNYINYVGKEAIPVMIEPEVVQLELFDKPEPVAQFAQEFISGISRQEAKAEIKQALNKTNPTSMEMILAGFRTRTTRTAEYLEKNPVKVGDLVEHFGIVEDGSTKRVLSIVTAIHRKGTPEFTSTWNLEGWTDAGLNTVLDYAGDAYAIVFKTIGIDEQIARQDTVGEKIINDQDIAAFKKYISKSKSYPEQFFTPSTKFEIFYNSNTGKRQEAPQSSTWIKQSNNRYDLIDVMTGEEYITNVDLETGIQYLSPNQVQVETPTKQENNIAIDVIDEFINDRSYTISLSDPATTMTIVPENTITRMQLERLKGSSLIGIGLNLINNDKIINEEGRLLGLASTYNLDKTVSQTQTTLSQFADQVGLGSAFAGTYSALKYLQSKGVDKITYDANGMLTKKMFDELNKIRQNMPEGTPLQKMSIKDHSNMIKNVEGYRNTAVGKYFEATIDVLKKAWNVSEQDLAEYNIVDIAAQEVTSTNILFGQISKTEGDMIPVVSFNIDNYLEFLQVEVYGRNKQTIDAAVSTETYEIKQQIEAINIQLELFSQNKPEGKPGTKRTNLNGCNG
jgi:hypothetical protein